MRLRPVTSRTIAAHLDRAVPGLEESTSLLLSADTSVLARLQRRRVADYMSGAPALPAIPSRTNRYALLTAGFAVAVGAVAYAWPMQTAANDLPVHGAIVGRSPPVISSTSLSWEPPLYTRLSPQLSETLDVPVPDGSVVTWTVRASGADRVSLITTTGDTAPARLANGVWRVAVKASKPLLWRIEAQGSGSVVRTDDHLVSVLADHAPLLTILAPPSRLSIAWTENHSVVLRALVRDDYLLGPIRLIATVASGRGEGVRFRERTLEVEIESRRGNASVVVGRVVALDSLKVEPGDEVLFAFEARDQRAPVAQFARSETVFLTMLDTVEASTTALAGIALDVEPAQFRSQRQIILDTEALLRDIRLKVATDTLARATSIGYDQHLLRVRYGGLVGEETEGMGETDDRDHAVDDPTSTAAITAESFRHNHDMEDNATLLSASVKALLKRALAAMWESEKHLRIGNARAALPWEYRALEALEEIRQASRAYVKRIGFEPPAIEIAAVRLSKRAGALAPLDLVAPGVGADDDAVIRRALDVLDRPSPNAQRGPLEAAGQWLATRIVAAPRVRELETLSLVRRVIDGCIECADAARRGLLAALPPPPTALRPQRSAHGGLRPRP